jgi:hypothetical protein
MDHAPVLLKERLRRWTLFLGVLQITFGCLIGFIPPGAVAWFRGIVMAHIEYAMNGIMVIALGLLLREMHLGARALKVWFVTLQLGTWTNGTAGLAAAFLGSTSTLMPTLNEKFPPPHGTASPLVTGLLQVCGVTVMIALGLTLYGLFRARPGQDNPSHG